MSEQPAGPARGGRYQRSFNGLLAALLVTVVTVVGVGWVASLFRTSADVDVETVDYLEAVELADTAGLRVVHPETLPEGWRATSAEPTVGDRPTWGMGMLTDDGDFVGIRQADESVESLLATYVDQDATDDGPVEVESTVAPSWRRWSDEGGDTGFSAEIEDETVLVYGSAPAAEIERFLATLTR